MKQKIAFLLLFVLMSVGSFAQKEKLTRDDKDEKNQARLARINNKNDYALFRRQMQGLKEFADEKKKIPNLQKNNKGPVKVTAAIDSNDNDNEASEKRLIGYIRQDVGDNSTNMYEILYDRVQKKIVSVKHTQEGIDADREEMEERAEKATTKKPTTKKAVVKKSKDEEDEEGEVSEKKAKPKTKATKKSKDEDEEDDPDEDKPSKTRHKESDED
jgi:hypothetical protein